jgi:fumarylpyruvate hydrolase
MDYVISPPPQVSVPVVGLDARFPVHRVYCVGRNYADHVAEMGGDPKSEPPVFFSKPASALVTDGEAVRYPQATSDLHHEVELAVALASGGRELTLAEAAACVYGYGIGIDFTRRDLQSIAKKHGRPWDTAKGFDQSAPLSALTPKANFAPSTDTPICLTVNDEQRQSALLGQMIWSVAEIIEQLSRLFELKAGDIIYTGTPAGVAAVVKGDKLCGEIAGLSALNFDII